MHEPQASRPHMPGYGVVGASEGTGLLSWSWAEAQLTASHDYWLATVRPDGRPHGMPVWAVWTAGALVFSTAPGSRKARNLATHPEVVVTTDNPHKPVVVEGSAEMVGDEGAVVEFTALSNAKYGTDYPIDFYLDNLTFRVAPMRVIALDDDDFTGSPTRWTFMV